MEAATKGTERTAYTDQDFRRYWYRTAEKLPNNCEIVQIKKHSDCWSDTMQRDLKHNDGLAAYIEGKWYRVEGNAVQSSDWQFLPSYSDHDFDRHYCGWVPEGWRPLSGFPAKERTQEG